MNTSNASVDVLAVMDKAQQVLGELYFKYQRKIGPFASQALASVHQLPPARAAVAELIAVAECEEALEMPNDEGVRVLERHGWSHADRFDLTATDFVRRLRRAALARVQGGQP